MTPTGEREARRRRRAVWAVALGSLAAGTVAATAGETCEYTAELIAGPDCGPPYGGAFVIPLAINDHGQVAGYWTCPVSSNDHAFVWDEVNGFVTLPKPAGVATARAHDINNHGVVVGYYGGNVVPRRGFIFLNDEMVDLGLLPGANVAKAMAINESGQVVGTSGNIISGPGNMAFLWENGRMTNLHELLGLPASSVAEGINSRGAVVGRSARTGNETEAFLVQDGVVTMLGSVPGGTYSEATAINDEGYIVGRAMAPDPLNPGDLAWHAFRRSPSGIMEDLGVLPECDRSFAEDINDHGEVVGSCDGPLGGSAFVFRNGAMHCLEPLIAPGDPIGLTGARGVNNSGAVAVRTTVVVGAWLDLIIGDVDGDCLIGSADMLLLLAAWGSADADADVNGDGTVNISDLLLLLINWTTG